jgi:Ca2+-transporting ATPase
MAGGKNKSDVAMDAASVVLLAADPKDTSQATGIALLLPALAEGRRARMNVQKTVIFYLACKLGIVLLFVVGLSVTGTVPLNPIQVVVLEMLMDLGAGSTFTFEKNEGDLLPPRSTPIGKLPSVFRNTTFFLLALGGLLLFVVVGGSFVYGQHLYPAPGACEPVTFAFAAWLAAHVFWGLACRTLTRPVLRKQGLFSNPAFLIWVAVVLALSGLVIAVPIVRLQLGLCIIPLEMVGWIVLISFLVMFVPFELVKEVQVLSGGEVPVVGDREGTIRV